MNRKGSLMKNQIRVTCLMCLVLPSLTVASEIRLNDVQIKLFLKNSGQLSPDVTEMNEFFAWNFRPFGDGIPSDDRFSDFLIVAELKSSEEVFEAGAKLSVRVTTKGDGKVVFEDSVAGIYVGPDGVIHEGFWVSDQECDQLIVDVSLGEQKLSRELPFECGE